LRDHTTSQTLRWISGGREWENRNEGTEDGRKGKGGKLGRVGPSQFVGPFDDYETIIARIRKTFTWK